MPRRFAPNMNVSLSLAFVLPLLLAACVGRETRGVPLYPGPARGADEVAGLIGDIDTVDGRDVSSSERSFEVLPGCHVVTTRARVAQGWTVAGIPPRWTFVIQVQAGHGYVLEYTGRSGTSAMNALEKDARGQIVASLAPTSDRALIERCRAKAQGTACAPRAVLKAGNADRNGTNADR